MDRLLATANRSHADLLACSLVTNNDLSAVSVTEFVEIINRVNRVNMSGSEFASGFCAAVRHIVASGYTVPTSMIMFADGNAILASVGVTTVDVSWSKAQRSHIVRTRTVRPHQAKSDDRAPVMSEQGRRSRRRGGRGRMQQPTPTRILARDDARSAPRGAVRDIEPGQRPPARIAALTYADATKVVNALREYIHLPERADEPVAVPNVVAPAAIAPVAAPVVIAPVAAPVATPVTAPAVAPIERATPAALPHLLADVDWA